jgi:Glycosyltransferase family 87
MQYEYVPRNRIMRIVKPSGNVTGFILILLGSIFFVVNGISNQRYVLHSVDFMGVYGGARCLLKGCNPYNEQDIYNIYVEAGGNPKQWYHIPPKFYNATYLPTALFLAIPFACLPWGPAHLAWLAVSAISFIVAALLVWDLARVYAPLLSGALIALFVATSTMFLLNGNPACISISLCTIGVWCLLRNRNLASGILCLAISLLLKPHVSGMVWLYFLLASPQHRKRAWQTLLVASLLAIPALVWVSLMPASSHWARDLHTNVVGVHQPGFPADPGPTDPDAPYIVDLQAVFSVFRNDPQFYNAITLIVSGILLLFWAGTTMRARPSQAKDLFGLAAIAPLSLLPIYHRVYDTRLMLLVIPALAVLFAQRRMVASWLAVFLTTAGIILTGHQLISRVGPRIHFSTATFSGEIKTVLLLRSMPVITLLMGIFYLCMFRFNAKLDASGWSKSDLKV